MAGCVELPTLMQNASDEFGVWSNALTQRELDRGVGMEDGGIVER